jgi:hypothetical protein
VTAHNPEPPSHSGRFYGDRQEVEPYPARKKKHWLRRFVIALVVLVGLLVAADRIALHFAQSELAAKIAQEQDLSQKPTVKIDGFPFLTQALARDFPHATIDIHGLSAQGVPISDLHADLRGVHVSSGYNAATVDTLTATAELNYTDLSTVLTQKAGFAQVHLSDGGDGQVKATISLAGLISTSVTVKVTLLPDNTLLFVSGTIQTPLSAVGLSTPSNLNYKLPLGALPFGMTLTALNIGQTGVDIVATGHNVALSQTSSLS